MTWLVQGCKDWLQQGLTVPDTLIRATEAERQAQNPVQDFIETQCDTSSPENRVATLDLYQSFREFCDISGYRYVLTVKKFTQHLRILDLQEVKTSTGTKVFQGIKLRAIGRSMSDIT